MAKQKRPHRRNFYSPKRRAVYAQGDEINHLELFERDNWTCWLCSNVINRRFRFPHIMAATVDHVTPISKGGTHTWDNVRAAHAKCNFTRGDSLLDPDSGIMVA